jgi:hypothetical protein
LSDDPVVQERLNEITRYLTQGYTDREIYQMMKIPASTYYNYKRQIQKESAERFKEQRLEDVALARDQLEGQLSRYLRIGEEKLIQSKDTMNPNKDTTGLLKEVTLLAIRLFDLKVDGVLALHNQNNKRLPEGESPKPLSGSTESKSEGEEKPDESTDDNPIV